MRYIELGELKSMLRINDVVDDDLLAAHIEAASRTIDDICHRTFDLADTATARVFHPDSQLVVRTDDIGSLDGFVLKIDENATATFNLTITDATLEPLNALAARSSRSAGAISSRLKQLAEPHHHLPRLLPGVVLFD